MAHFSVEFNRIHQRVLSNNFFLLAHGIFPRSLQALTRADNRARYKSNPSRPVDLLPTSRTYKEHQAYLRRSGQVPVRQDQDPIQQGRDELKRVLDNFAMAPRTRTGKSSNSISDPANPVDTENTGDTVSITRTQFENFNHLQEEYNALANDYGLNKAELANLHDNNDELTKRIEERDALITALKEKIDELGEALRDVGKNPALVKNKELWEQVCVATEKYLSRTWKILLDEADAIKATKEVIAFLPSPLTIDEDDFVKVYKRAVNKSLQDIRHKIQSDCKRRVRGTEIFEAFTRKNLTF